MSIESDGPQIEFSSILASSVHEMKNSLSMLINYLDSVIEHFEQDKSSEVKLLSQLQYNAKHVNNNLMQLLALYRLENAMYSLNLGYNPIVELVEDLIAQNKTLMDYKGITLDVDIDNDLYWFFDKDLLGGSLNSIINNSFKYTKDLIRISAYEADGYLNICIEDNGTGYPEHMLQDGKNQGKSISFKTGNTGLGLYFSSMVARCHKNREREGFITLNNSGTYGGGCFCISLP
ncbi:MAG: HAMP domain-containing histidine kinase [Nitrospirae bacterium]|nr:HAMP domain-containing histidine kinase [Nitrospirota bacterium]MBF0592237.1 HAMP domain-containing histidine kinase [Nitrospirota bacterium]